MYQWYKDADICFAHLDDIEASRLDLLDECRWFTRGWTLQELLAPSKVDFYDKFWTLIGTKESLANEISRLTLIDIDILRDHQMISFSSIAQKMSWASFRETTRIEDIAYCLMGIFSVNMPLLYGEGQRVFIRL
jgi:hypothetical protein